GAVYQHVERIAVTGQMVFYTPLHERTAMQRSAGAQLFRRKPERAQYPSVEDAIGVVRAQLSAEGKAHVSHSAGRMPPTIDANQPVRRKPVRRLLEGFAHCALDNR